MANNLSMKAKIDGLRSEFNTLSAGLTDSLNNMEQRIASVPNIKSAKILLKENKEALFALNKLAKQITTLLTNKKSVALEANEKKELEELQTNIAAGVKQFSELVTKCEKAQASLDLGERIHALQDDFTKLDLSLDKVAEGLNGARPQSPQRRAISAQLQAFREANEATLNKTVGLLQRLG